ncbi:MULTISPECIES: DUF1398 family protein [Staphylococcus]|uniref:DUF1398 family protein n=1 Tax=Staphylococcus condimenti TaxID=70255 RepID=A0AB37H346_9STAP|nr:MULTISPECIES: DUF1398 family protein [Staphylococcus]AMY05412.1 hypothetical protein A4G25_05430 [Staphylococcus condimenti]APR61619.1 hypothetical protein BTZ13_10465 [Staphylococcus condimenti]MDK8644466.1 DUF1398 family protein [Staphylococcus condimenti]OFP02552.1 hypothetical protein HMPREF3007_02785 [Staphylococcus sp. HMSC065E08]QQS82784.1 DUF1398 family protein [Staphylococcus condimenti]
MKFTKLDLKQVLESEVSTADFPETLKKLRGCDVTKYVYNVKKGVYTFNDQDGDEISIKGNSTSILIPRHVDKSTFNEFLQASRAGEFTFDEFSNRAASLGIASWIVDLTNFEITYYNKAGAVVKTIELSAF